MVPAGAAESHGSVSLERTVNVRALSTVLTLLAVGTSCSMQAQTPPAATQELGLTAFGAVSGTYTGLGSGKNAGITAGADLAFHPFQYFLPSIEIRGTYPFYSGSTDSFRDLLGGIRLTSVHRGYRPYVDVLFGRAQVSYENGGYPNASHTFLYQKSPGNLLSAGGGADFRLTPSFAIKADVQWQFYSSPVSASGHLNAFPVTIGVVYRFHPP